MANVVDIVIKGVDKSKKALTAPIKNLKDLKTAAKTLGPAFAIGVTAAVGALGALVFQSITTAEETAKLSKQLGVSTEALSTMSFAARISGSDVETLQKGMKRLSVQVLDAGRGLKEAQDNFSALGLEVRDTNGDLKSAEQLFKESADAISLLPDGLEKAALAQKVFGKAGAQLIPLLNEGSAGIEKLQQKARDLGLEIDTNTAEAAEQFIDNLETMKGAVTGLGNSIAKELLPGLTAMTTDSETASSSALVLKSVIAGISATISFVGKVLFSVFEGIGFIFDVAATSIASLAAKMFAAFEGGLKAVQAVDKDFKEQLAARTQASADALDAIWNGSNKKQVASNKNKNKDILNDDTKTNDQKKRDALKAAKEQEALDKRTASRKIQTASNSFAAIGALTTENANAQKAVAIGLATISAFQSISKTLGTGGFFAIPLAISTGALALAQVGKIAGIGFQEGGVVPGSSFTGDRILAGLNSQEVVLTAAQTENLAGQLGGGGAGGAPMRVVGEVDGQVFIDLMIEANQDGRFPIQAGSIV